MKYIHEIIKEKYNEFEETFGVDKAPLYMANWLSQHSQHDNQIKEISKAWAKFGYNIFDYFKPIIQILYQEIGKHIVQVEMDNYVKDEESESVKVIQSKVFKFFWEMSARQQEYIDKM